MKAHPLTRFSTLAGAVMVLTMLASTVLSETAAADPANDATPGALPPPPHVAAPPPNATVTASGLAYLELRPGVGSRHPSRTDRVEVNYTGWTTDGRMFDSSVTRGRPATFPLSGVIEGFAEGLALMTEGQRIRVWIPENLAYQGRPGRPQGMLVFDLELIRIL